MLLKTQLCEAVIILMDSDSQVYQSLDQTYTNAKTIVDTYEWPMPAQKLLKNPHFVSSEDLDELTKSEIGAEEKLINKKLKEAQLKVHAQWIPTSLWEIVAIREKLRDENYWKTVQKEGDPRGFKFFDSEEEKRRFEIGVGLKIKLLADQANVTLADLSANSDLQEHIALNAMKEITTEVQQKAIENEAMIPKPTRDILALARPLQKDLDAAAAGKPTLIGQVLRVEKDAHRLNQGLLWRGTDGIQLDDHREELIDFCVRLRGEKSNGESDFFSVDEAVDFPNNLKKLGTGGYLTPGQLSYAYSPLSAYLGDGPLMNYGGACTYSYCSGDRESKYTYALPLDKKWAYTFGSSITFLPGTPSTDGIFGQGEEFHPRFGPSRHNEKVLPSFETIGPKSPYLRSIPLDRFDCNKASLGPLPLSPEILSSIKEFLARTFPKSSKEYREQTSATLVMTSNLSEIWNQLIATRARIVKYDHEVTSEPASIPELVKALKNQGHISGSLREKISRECHLLAP